MRGKHVQLIATRNIITFPIVKFFAGIAVRAPSNYAVAVVSDKKLLLLGHFPSHVTIELVKPLGDMFSVQVKTDEGYKEKAQARRTLARSWEGQDGQKHYRTEVIAERVTFLERQNAGGMGYGADEDGPDEDPRWTK